MMFRVLTCAYRNHRHSTWPATIAAATAVDSFEEPCAAQDTQRAQNAITCPAKFYFQIQPRASFARDYHAEIEILCTPKQGFTHVSRWPHCSASMLRRLGHLNDAAVNLLPLIAAGALKDGAESPEEDRPSLRRSEDGRR